MSNKNRKRAVWIIEQVKANWIIALLLSVIMLVVIVYLTIDQRTLIAIQKMHLAYLFLAFLLTVLSYFFSGLAFNILAGALGKKLSVWEGFEVFTGSNFINLTTPFFNFANLPVKIYFLTNFDIEYTDATAIVAVHALLSIWFFLVAPIIILLTRISLIGTPLSSVFVVAVILIFFLTFLFILFTIKPAVFEKIIGIFVNNKAVKHFFGSKQVENFCTRLVHQVELTDKSLRILFNKHPFRLFLAFVVQILSWVAIIATVPVILMGLNWFNFLGDIFLRVLVLNFIISVAPTPGGSGVAELGIVGVLVDVIPSYLIAPVVLIWRFTTFYLAYGFSAIFFVVLIDMRRKKSKD